MKIETKLKKFVKNVLQDKISNGFSIIKDSKTDIWYLVGFDINKNLFILNKAETGTNIERIKQLFPGYDYDNLKINQYHQIDMFPGFFDHVDVCLVNDEEEGLDAGVGLIYETIN